MTTLEPLAAWPGEARSRIKGVFTDIDDTLTDNGRITAFRDYYDVACYEQTPTEMQQGFSLVDWRAANRPPDSA